MKHSDIDVGMIVTGYIPHILKTEKLKYCGKIGTIESRTKGGMFNVRYEDNTFYTFPAKRLTLVELN